MGEDYSGKLCVVTGAASGIGRALALSDADAAGLEETRGVIGAPAPNSSCAAPPAAGAASCREAKTETP